MSRSVSYPANCTWVLFTHFDQGEDEDTSSWEWQEFLGSLRWDLEHTFPSVYFCHKWLDREDHAIAENHFCYFGISEYCGLVAFWCLPKDDDYRDKPELARHWASQIERKCAAMLAKHGPQLECIGRASNGEAFYREVSS